MAKALLLITLLPCLGIVKASTGAQAPVGSGTATKTTTVNLRDHGVNAGAFRAAVAVLARHGGGILDIPAGSYDLDSRDLREPIMLPANVEVRGNGARISVRGTDITAAVFAARDASNILIRDLTVVGNGRALANSASGAFFQYTLSETARASASKIRLSDIRLDNFAAERWISFINANSAGNAISDVVAERISILSRPGNSIAPQRISVWAHALVVMGYKGPIAGVRITDFTADAAYIKSGIGIFERVSNVRMERVAIRSAGRQGAIDNAGAYAIALYGGTGRVTDVVIRDARIDTPRSAGIYAADVQGLRIADVVVTGQSDARIETLPKAAIALNGSRRVTVEGARFSGNAIDIAIVAPPNENGPTDVKLARMESRSARLASILINPGVGGGATGDISIVDSNIVAQGRGMQILNGNQPGRSIGALSIVNTTIASVTTHALDLTPFGPVTMHKYLLRQVRLQAANAALLAPGLRGDLTLDDVSIRGEGPEASGILLAPDIRIAAWNNVRLQGISRARAVSIGERRISFNADPAKSAAVATLSAR